MTRKARRQSDQRYQRTMRELAERKKKHAAYMLILEKLRNGTEGEGGRDSG